MLTAKKFHIISIYLDGVQPSVPENPQQNIQSTQPGQPFQPGQLPSLRGGRRGMMHQPNQRTPVMQGRSLQPSSAIYSTGNSQRQPANQDDDDDVIVTAVTKTKPGPVQPQGQRLPNPNMNLNRNVLPKATIRKNHIWNVS